jgi:hypothetical protein
MLGFFLQFIRVMAQNTVCSEDGPFFPPTSRYFIQNGIGIASDILQAPDWAIIFIILGAALLAMVIMLIALVSYHFKKIFQF